MSLKKFEEIRRFWETVRHLRAEQIVHRIWFRLHRPEPDLRKPPPLRAATGPWVLPARRRPSMTGPFDFLFLNEAGSLATVGWDGGDLEKLWRYNQHYFDDLNAIEAESRREWHKALIDRWITDNAPAYGTAWEPYPTSLRIVNWVKWAMAGNSLPATFPQSLAIQARWLSQRLERHLLGNHLFANAKALIFAAALLDGAEGDTWHELGTWILCRELPRQILQDGGHFELSTMYHALAFEDILDLINILRASNRGQDLLTLCEKQVSAMQDWLVTMTHPDGEIAFFNDAAIGIAPSPAELLSYAKRLGFAEPCAIGDKWLEQSGYARVMRGDAVLLADLARVGPSYLPGHAHADSLSFELSLGMHRVLVNSGTSLYGLSEERLRQRGTAAHNCVVVEGLNSSDVWSGFRVGRRANILLPQVRIAHDRAIIRAGHDGYRSLMGKPRHWRSWSMDQRSLTVEDHITNPNLNSIAWFHLHPDAQMEFTGPQNGVITLPNGRRLTWVATGGNCRLISDSWHPEFGIIRPARSLLITLHNGRSTLSIHWD